MAMVGQFGIGRHLAGAVQRSSIEAIDPQPKDRPPLLDRFQHLDRADAAGIHLERIALQDHQVSAFARLKGALALFFEILIGRPVRHRLEGHVGGHPLGGPQHEAAAGGAQHGRLGQAQHVGGHHRGIIVVGEDHPLAVGIARGADARRPLLAWCRLNKVVAKAYTTSD